MGHADRRSLVRWFAGVEVAVPAGEVARCDVSAQTVTGLDQDLPIVNLHWPYKDPGEPTAEELAKEMNGSALVDLFDPTDPTKKILEAGKQVPSFAVLRDDGSTASGCWIYRRLLHRGRQHDGPAGQLRPGRHRRLSRNGRSPGRPTGASCTTAPPRTSTASRGTARKLIEWDGSEMDGLRRPGHRADGEAGGGRALHHERGRRRTPVRPRHDADGPFPVHYEPFESPVANVIAPKVRGNPAARVFADDLASSREWLAGIPATPRPPTG